MTRNYTVHLQSLKTYKNNTERRNQSKMGFKKPKQTDESKNAIRYAKADGQN